MPEGKQALAHAQATRLSIVRSDGQLAEHLFLGRFEPNGIPAQIQGKEALEVTFSYDLNGLLKVTATLVSTGKEASIEIQMGQDKKDKTDVSSWKDSKDAKVYRAIIRTAERMLSRNGLPAGMRERMESLLFALKKVFLN